MTVRPPSGRAPRHGTRVSEVALVGRPRTDVSRPGVDGPGSDDKRFPNTTCKTPVYTTPTTLLVLSVFRDGRSSLIIPHPLYPLHHGLCPHH